MNSNDPCIASLSFGATRDFHFRKKNTDGGYDYAKYKLKNGDLVCMLYPTNRDWYHSLPKRKGITEPRINLTFRCIV
jgi:alpha-ketoglutarate-dependent dioxygenase alkB family protein 2